jgi:hypothetical protein
LIGDLADFSTLTITASGGNNTDVRFASGNIGQSAQLQIADHGGKGANVFGVGLSGVQNAGSQVNVTFQGGNGFDWATVFDSQNIQAGATAAFNLDGQAGKDTMQTVYTGRLQGDLTVKVAGGATPGPRNNVFAPRGSATLFLKFQLQPGSNGSLTSTMKGADGNDNLTDLVFKAATDTAAVNETANGGGGIDNGLFTKNVAFTNVANVQIVP